MKRNFKMVLAYDGTRYNGWQKQSNSTNTIQGKLEAALSMLLSQNVEVDGSGRTDAGVHAVGQTANFHCNTDLSAAELLTRLRHAMPEDIGILTLDDADERFHARLNAAGKTYVYTIWNSEMPNVFTKRYEWTISEDLNLESMRRCANCFLGTHDFRSFCSNRNMKKSTERTITGIDIQKTGERIELVFTGNGFLYNMVRMMTAAIVEVGRGKASCNDITALLEKRDSAGVPMAPARGLCLKEVYYR